jgi:hypothetical protein
LHGVQEQSAAGSRAAGVLAHSYAFLADCIPAGRAPAVRRAVATIARTSDA